MILEQFHFLRPVWLYALLLLPLLAWRLVRVNQTDNSWRKVCDPTLLQHLFLRQEHAEAKMPQGLILLGVALAIIALAGPTWEQLPQPVYRTDLARVYVLDLSLSMDAADIKPSRLIRAKQKLTDMLNQTREGLSALIVFAETAHIVSPLTEDNGTIINMIPTLSTNLMPYQGSRADLALRKSLELLQQAGEQHGEIILITDGVSEGSVADIAEQIKHAGHQLHVLGVGTQQGAPIPVEGGGFVKNDQGTIVVPSLDEKQLNALASTGGGHFAQITFNNDDIDSLEKRFISPDNFAANETGKNNMDLWDEKGYWLVLLLIPFLLASFRRGWLLTALLAIFLVPSQPSYALEWSELWKNNDQLAMDKFQQGKVQEAQKQFTDPQWKASAAYRAGDYSAAAANFVGKNNPNAAYNRANALAHQGKLQDAKTAYEQALKIDPDFSDAKINLKLVDDYLKKQKSQNKQKQDQKDKQEDSQDKIDGEQQNADKQEKNSAKGDEQKQQQQQKEQSQGNDKDSQPRKNDEKNKDNSNDLSQAQSDQHEKETQNTKEQQNQLNKSTDKDNDKQSKERRLTELDQATEQWLRRIPDDPGGLLREKFLRQSRRAQSEAQQSSTPW